MFRRIRIFIIDLINFFLQLVITVAVAIGICFLILGKEKTLDTLSHITNRGTAIINEGVNRVNEYTKDENGDGLFGKVEKPYQRPWYIWLIIIIFGIIGFVFLLLLAFFIWIFVKTYLNNKEYIKYAKVKVDVLKTEEILKYMKEGKKKFEKLKSSKNEESILEQFFDKNIEKAKYYFLRNNLINMMPVDFKQKFLLAEKNGSINEDDLELFKKFQNFFNIALKKPNLVTKGENIKAKENQEAIKIFLMEHNKENANNLNWLETYLKNPINFKIEKLKED